MTELEMYELWLTLREWANYNQLNQTIANTGRRNVSLDIGTRGKGDLLAMRISRLLSVLMMWLISLMLVRKMNSLE